MVNVMLLIPVAQAAVADPSLGAVRFAMKDGSKLVTVLVSSLALENSEIAEDHGYFIQAQSEELRADRQHEV